MAREKILRLFLFMAVTGVHLLLIFFLAFNVKTASQETPESARVMKLTDLAEEIPRPPAPPRPEPEMTTTAESIAEQMIETDAVPDQTLAPRANIIAPPGPVDEYLPMHQVSVSPKFDPEEIAAAMVYPPIARRSGVEGRVILELFVDRDGVVRQILILQEDPPDRGFGESAVSAFTGRRGVPALANGEAVSCRYRWPVTFRLK